MLERVLILRAAHTVVHGDVLHRLHEKRDSLCRLDARLQSADHPRQALRSRSPSGFRLMEIRPLFSVVLVPSAPMNEERLSTAGIFENDVKKRCCFCVMAANEITFFGAWEFLQSHTCILRGKYLSGMTMYRRL